MPRSPRCWMLLLAAVAVAPSLFAQDDVASRLKRYLDKHPAADANRDGVLTEDEARAHRAAQKSPPSATPPELPGETATTSPQPTHRDIPYGPHERNRLDLYLAPGDQPTPLVLYFHGGSFKAGDKQSVADKVAPYLKAGISVASANYRYSSHALYPAPMEDGARALQFLRANAAQWNLNPRHVVLSGGSAGGTLALWIAPHDDLADPTSDDPVARQSTRVLGVIGLSAPCSMEPAFIKEHIGSENLGGAMLQLFGVTSRDQLSLRPHVEAVHFASPINHVSAGDPPLLLIHNPDLTPTPMPADTPQQKWIHHPKFSEVLREAYAQQGLECRVYWKSQPAPAGAEVEFVLAQVAREGR
jgi:acetyl esterase/lipase